MRRALQVVVLGWGAALAATVAAAQDGDPRARLRAGDLPGALRAAEARLAADPTDAVALAVRGRVLLQRPGHQDPGTAAGQALDDLERAVAAGVDDPATLMALSRAHAYLRDTTHDPMARRAHAMGAHENAVRARATAEAALAAAPDDPEAHKTLADVCLSAGDPDRALEHYRIALARPGAGWPAALLADVRRAHDNALALVRSRELGQALDARHWDDAVRLAVELASLVPDDPQPCLAAATAEGQRATRAATADEAFACRQAAVGHYLEAVARDVRRRGPGAVDEGAAGLQAAYTAALTFIGRGRGDAGRAVLERLYALLPPGRARARITISIATEHKEAAHLIEAAAAYTEAIADYRAQPRGEPWDGIFLAKAYGDLALLHRGAMFRVTDAARGAERDACVAAFRASMAAAPPGDSYAVYARANLGRLLAEGGDRAGAAALLRDGLDRAAERALPDGTPDAAARLTDTLNLRRFLRECRP